MFINSQAPYQVSAEVESAVVRVGILYSLSGTMAVSGAPLRDAALMAIAEINCAGGILGKSIVPVIEDGASSPSEFALKARKLIQKDKITTVFGCWTSLSRKAVLPIFEEFNAQLWYPVQYEGLESSKNVFYTGSCLNQQVEPAVKWLLEHGYKRFYLLGSDYVFPRTANKIIKAQLKAQNGILVGEEYQRLGTSDFHASIDRIQQSQPQVVFNTLNGDSNLAFYQQYHQAGITATDIPIMAVSVAEAELQQIGSAITAGHYASWSYFQSVDSAENRTFVQNFQGRYGENRVTSDPIEAAYCQVYLWKQAVEAAQSFEIDRVRIAAYGQTFEAPGGSIEIAQNQHLWKNNYIGRALPSGQFEILSQSDRPIKPLPWMGIEEWTSDHATLAIDLLAEVPRGIQYSWELEQKSQQLESAMEELVATKEALKDVNTDLEIRVKERTMQLELEIAERKRAETELRDSEIAATDKAEELAETLQQLLQAQSQLIQTEKMSSLGQLVAGIAHEINNPVNFIYGNLAHTENYANDMMGLIQLYQKFYPQPGSEIQAELDSIDLDFLIQDMPPMLSSMKVGANRIRQLVLSLRNFSRLDDSEITPFNIHDGIDSSLMILQHRLKASSERPAIQVVKEYGNLPLIECYPGQLNQVFMNILVNAIDALEEKGESSPQILIRTEVKTNPYPEHSTDQKPREVLIQIQDNGAGIPDEVRGKLFDYLFTTKPSGKGTGLGLYISHQIVTEKHGGKLYCSSELGQGTEFWIELPIVQQSENIS